MFNEEIRKVEAQEREASEESEEKIKPETSSAIRDGTQDVEEDAKLKMNGHDTDKPSRHEAVGPVLRIRLDDHVADVTLEDMAVYSTHDSLKRRVESVLQVASRTITPLAPIHPKSSWVARGGSKRIAVKAET